MKRLVLPLLALAALSLTGCKKDLVCPQGELDCGGTCVALDSDPAHCGACGNACGALQVCDGGACACAPDVAACGGACADLRIDPQNCGTCGTRCGTSTVCDGASGCIAPAACLAPQTVCGGSCVDLGASPSHCGACGHACAAGEACIAGACGAPLYAACYWTSEVKPLTASLRYGGPTRSTGTARPFRLALAGSTLLSAAGQPQASLSFLPLPSGAVSAVQLPGWDLEAVALVSSVALVANAAVGTVEVIALDGTVLDEIPMPDQQDAPNPMGLAAAGDRAWVGLNATPFSQGGAAIQQVARIDLTIDACRAPQAPSPCATSTDCAAGHRCIGGSCRASCGEIGNVIDLTQVAGSADAGAMPAPTALAAVNGKVYVALSNQAWGHVTCDGFEYDAYAVPAGPGRLATIDPANLDTVSTVTLGEGCRSPSDLAARGAVVWVSCGSYCFGDVAPGAVLPVDVSGATPAVGAAIPLGGTIGGALTLCGSGGYVADQRKTGAVVRFDPAGATTAAPAVVCGADANGNALAADILCSE